MYAPPHFVEDRRDILHALIRAHPLGLLVCNGPDGPVANPVPFLIETGGSGADRLACHLARANPQWKLLEAGAPALALFQGPQAYVSPSWYATKRETGKVVPTWNYCIVQARGEVSVFHDPDRLRRHVGALTDRHEADRKEPWALTDAPEPYVEAMLRGIVGVEIKVRDLLGKWKVSQNRPDTDRAGVASGMASENTAMARLVSGYSPPERR
jgi:transcriptional regulator